MTPRGQLIWSTVHAERRALLADLRQLEPSQWNTQSLCDEWDIHDVLAHLIDGAKTTRLGFVRRMLSARFDFDKETAAGVARERRADPFETLAAFEAVLTSTSTPPAALATRLVEAFLHGEDIRRPLGISGDYPVAQVIDALAYQLRTSSAMGGSKEAVAGWQFVATDADFTSGEGPAVQATALTLLLAASGRDVNRAELTGPGAEGFVAGR